MNKFILLSMIVIVFSSGYIVNENCIELTKVWKELK